jgi:hypothetical protein
MERPYTEMDDVASFVGAESAIRRASIALPTIRTPATPFAESRIQPVGEVAERIGGLGQTRVFLFEFGDPLLECPDLRTNGLTILPLTARTGVSVRGFVRFHESRSPARGERGVREKV